MNARTRSIALALVLIAAGLTLVIVGAVQLRAGGDLDAFLPAPTAIRATETPKPTLTEPIVPPAPTATWTGAAITVDSGTARATLPPTRTSMAIVVPSPLSSATMSMPAVTEQAERRNAAPTATRTSTATPTPSSRGTTSGLYTLRQRVGVCGAGSARDTASQLGFGWYLDWSASPDRFRSPTVEYMPMIRLKNGAIQPSGEALMAAIDALPGALWLIGNEPDVKWQDSVTPEAYVEVYHDLYALLKARDPTCQVAIGGVSQPTPLRMRYLGRILDAYQARYGEPMPVDVWNVHNFILREERDSWGVDIPPGMNAQTGVLREIADHDKLSIFRQQILDFRRWMAQRGQQDKPLIVTEYGILMPAEYGFPVDRVTDFLLRTFEFLRTAVDPELGYPADGHRLVQRWCWFSTIDDRYPTGNLVDADGGGLTPLGQAFRSYLRTTR